jgi:hypothetical protein
MRHAGSLQLSAALNNICTHCRRYNTEDYSSWQISDDTGSDVRNGEVHDEVHAVGGQLGLTYLPWQAVFNFHAFYEFEAQDRFQGQAFGFSLAKKF